MHVNMYSLSIYPWWCNWVKVKVAMAISLNILNLASLHVGLFIFHWMVFLWWFVFFLHHKKCNTLDIKFDRKLLQQWRRRYSTFYQYPTLFWLRLFFYWFVFAVFYFSLSWISVLSLQHLFEKSISFVYGIFLIFSYIISLHYLPPKNNLDIWWIEICCQKKQ